MRESGHLSGYVNIVDAARFLPCRARIGLQAGAAQTARTMAREFPFSPPNPSPKYGRGERRAEMVCLPFSKSSTMAGSRRHVGTDDACHSTRQKMLFPSGTERIFPTQSREAREVSIRRAENQTVFNGDCGEVRVRHEVRLDAWCFKEFAKNFAMAIRGFRDPRGIAAKPREYLPPCVGYGRGTLEHTWIGGHAQESQ